MDTTYQLIDLCLAWRKLIRTKEAQFKEIQTSAERIQPSLNLIQLKTELSLMEDELCERLILPPHLYEINYQKPPQA